jgi:lipoyl(octanoyl) transferase
VTRFVEMGSGVAGMPRPVAVRRLGTIPYGDGLDLQAGLVAERRAGEIPDTLLLLEHPHVLTLGSGAHDEHVLATQEERERLNLELFRTGRGGDVTYHGPGQLVGYPILDLKPDRCDLHLYLRELEEMLIEVVGTYGLEGTRVPGLTGVWIGGRKVAAIGVRVSSGWITSHGFALNVDPDLSYFASIVPCGIQDREVTSIAREIGEAPSMGKVADRVEAAFRVRFEGLA